MMAGRNALSRLKGEEEEDREKLIGLFEQMTELYL